VVPVADRGPKFQIDDGIGCEGCHGAASGWLAAHDDRQPDTRAASIAAGMRRLDEPAELAQVCLGCHLGDETRLATHAMMAAGHPRLSFELATFRELWRTSGGREHYRVDDDYRRRKVVAGVDAVWLEGMLAGAERSIAQLRRSLHPAAALPEFAAFNCYSCHREMGLQRWAERPGTAGGRPGDLRLNDGQARVLATVLAGSRPADGRALSADLGQLSVAANSDRAAGQRLASQLERRLAGWRRDWRKPGAVTTLKTKGVSALLAEGVQYPDYATAEQALMAVVTLGDGGAQQQEVDALFAALADDEAFSRTRFAELLQQIPQRRSSP
jgi:hypothetical protein